MDQKDLREMVKELKYGDTKDPLMKNDLVLGKILYDSTYGFSIMSTKHAIATGNDIKILLKTKE